ncbi:MAG: helix-turn-helix domain-containing protein [bacterium]|nr:helix-turn-helix domain-containing protein [bacterium]
MPSKIEKILQEAMASKHIGVERLQSLTEIPSHFLDALLVSDFENLPAKPYVRGYLVKLADVLDLNEDELVSIYESEFLKSSGSTDALPSNRFALPKFSYKTFVFPALALLIIIYVAVFALRSRTPYLEIISLPASSEAVVVASPTILLEGRVKPGDSLFVNGEEIPVDSSGRFAYEYALEPELNTLVFEVKRFLGKEIRVTRQIFYRSIQLEVEDDGLDLNNSTSSDQGESVEENLGDGEEVIE